MTGIVVLLVLFAFSSKYHVASETYQGDDCTLESGEPGTCATLDKCPSAVVLVKENKKPINCGFEASTPIVCCSKSQQPQTLTVVPANVPKKSVLPPGNATKRACQKYNPRPLFTLGAFGGEKSLAGEFPHMAILGYIDQKKNIHWLCGGSLISRDFVLTAAHCISSKRLGKVQKVRLGDLDIKSTTDKADPQDFDVVQTFVHPDYRSSTQYNDIALIKMDREISYSEYIKPACLQTDHDIGQQTLQATGWGKTDFAGEPSSHLMKVDLSHIDNKRCAKYYENASKKRLPRGIDDVSQMCAGDSGGKDTCPGDSGGPLQFEALSNPIQYTHWRIVGVTSFGKACGIERDSCGVYTRVSYYVPWIEEIVWPNSV